MPACMIFYGVGTGIIFIKMVANRVKKYTLYIVVIGVSISTIWRRRVFFNLERRRHRGRRELSMAELKDRIREIKERSMDAGIIMIEGELAAQSLYASRSAISEALISLDPIGSNLRWHDFTLRVTYNVPGT